MRQNLIRALTAFALLALGAASAGAVALPGDPAPNFTKNELDYPAIGQTTPRSLTDYLGKVVILFEMGWN